MKTDYVTAFCRLISDGFITVAGAGNPVAKLIFEKIGYQHFAEIASANAGALCRFLVRKLYAVEIFRARTFVPSAPIIDFAVKAIVIPEVFRPYGEHIVVVLMLELPDLDIFSVCGLQSFASIDEPFSMFRCPRHPRPNPELFNL